MRDVVIIVLLIALILCSTNAPIQDATYDELIEVPMIGKELAEDIISFVCSNPECTVEDLIDIKGIGDKRIKELERRWR